MCVCVFFLTRHWVIHLQLSQSRVVQFSFCKKVFLKLRTSPKPYHIFAFTLSQWYQNVIKHLSMESVPAPQELHHHRPRGWGGGRLWRKSGVDLASSFQFPCGNFQRGALKWRVVWMCVYTKRGVKYTPYNKMCGMGTFFLMFTFVCVYRVFECPQKLCGMGIVFIHVFHTIRPLSNFVRRADQDSNSFHLKLLLQAL